MKDTLLKILKISLVVITGLLLILLVFGLVLSLDWPWWVGLFLLLALAGMGIGIVFLKKLWFRRREQKFVQQVIAQDEAHLKTLKGKEIDESKELQARWKEAVEALRRSHLRKYGNPLYVLPWYLIMGESGSGKTTSIKSARLSSPFAEVTHTSGLSGTKNCDWWFFEQAIIIDTAGRYAIPIDEGRDKEEWQKFLNLLVKYRKKEPLHGLIVTVAADKLLESSPEVLEEDGKNIRQRIDELMRVLGVKFPVYVLVTKCDLVQGMTQFCDHLTEEGTEQPMGVLNHGMSADVTAFINRAMNTIGERLRNLRLLLLHKPESEVVDPGLLLFPEEFENLKRGIDSFAKMVFQENPYQETPVMRGLYFSSGRQEGSPFSSFLSTLGLIGEKDVLPGTNKGLFLHDFFSKILPKDRRLFAPTRRAIEWQTLTRNLGLISWVVICVAICGLLSFSFVKNLRTLRGASHEISKPFEFQGEFIEDLAVLNRFDKAIINVEKQNRNWWVPRFGLHESINIEQGLKDHFSSQYRKNFLARIDNRIKENIHTRLSEATIDEVIGQYIVHLTRRINLLKARLDNRDIESIQAIPRPAYVPLLTSHSDGTGHEIKQKFSELYFHYILWRSDIDRIEKEIDILQSWLKPLLALKAPTPRWIATWVNGEGSVPLVTLENFWGGSGEAEDETTVAPAFTRLGKEMIDTLIEEIESALPDPLFFANQKQEFGAWHRNRSFESWENFSMAFPDGRMRLKSKEEWRKMAAMMSTDKGPYFVYIEKIADDLEPFSEEKGLPSWLNEIYRLQSTKKTWAAGKGAIAMAADKGRKVITSIEKTFGKEEETSRSALQSISSYGKYQEALESITVASASRNQAFEMALKVFTEDRVASESPFYAADGAAARLKTALTEGTLSDTVWKLVRGPFDFLWEYTLMETACHLQSQWDEEVLADVEGASRQQAMELLLGQNGYAWKYVKGPAAPFVKFRQKIGYNKRELLGRAAPFKATFFAFLKRGAGAHVDAVTRESYRVSINGLPTDSNPDTKIKPHATHLELQCKDRTQTLDNYHFPVTKNFEWSSETCSDIELKIDIGKLVLSRRYTGSLAFVNFLEDFKNGERTFHPDNFPHKQSDLEKLGIKYIKVKYKFKGADAVLKKFRARPEEIIRSIAECWDH
jgi:type VI secretion system protein ImpL